MIITFCGHSQLTLSEKDNKALYDLLEKTIINDPTCVFYLGNYGDFDFLCFKTLKKLQILYPKIKICFITPYIDTNYDKLIIAKENYDEIIFPPLENVAKKFAIIKRNEWMVEQCDLLIAYVKFDWGGAAQTLDYAKRKNKRFINLT